MKIKLIIFLSLIMFFSLIRSAQAANWNITKVDWRFMVGEYSSIAVDPNNGSVHISYYDAFNSNDRPKYANTSSCSWLEETLEAPGGSPVGYGTSIALGTDGNVHISYVRDSPNVIRYATNAGGWSYLWALGEQVQDRHTSIAVDSNNNVYITYLDNINRIRCVKKDNLGIWSVEFTTLASSFAYPSIAVDHNNKVHIAFWDGNTNKTRYATNASGAWQVSDVTPISFRNPSIAIDSTNNVHISGYDSSNRELVYAINSSGAWDVKPPIDSVGDVGRNSSIAIDSNNNVHISYNDVTNAGNERVKYATNASGAWVVETIPTFGIRAKDSSIAIDSNNNVHISLWDVAAEDLYYATTALFDCGLRVYDGTSTISIACEPGPNPTSPLRISTGGNTYGILLIAPTDACASKVKIKIPADPGIRALRKIPAPQ